VSDLTGEKRRRTIVQRSAAGLSVAGVSAAVILTGSAASSASAGAAPSAAPRGGNTLTETTSSAAGTMKIQVKYRNEPRGKIKLLAVTYSGDSKIAIRKPGLLFVFSPGNPLGPPPGPIRHKKPWRRAVSPRILVFSVSVRAGHLHDFAGALPPRLIAAANRGGGFPARELLSVSLAALPRPKGHGPTRISIHPVMQAGLILTPEFP
jgi:hypothetical protein